MVQDGSAFVLRLGDDGDSPDYVAIAGLRTTRLSIESEQVHITRRDGGAWRELLDGGGRRQVLVAGEGILAAGETAQRLRHIAVTGHLANFELGFDSGQRLRGRFQVTKLESSSHVDGDRSFLIGLASSGFISSDV